MSIFYKKRLKVIQISENEYTFKGTNLKQKHQKQDNPFLLPCKKGEDCMTCTSDCVNKIIFKKLMR